MPPDQQLAPDRIASVLVAEIRDGTIAVGAPLPPERELCERFGVSRTPIRTALVKLAEEGLLEEAGNAGYAVREFSEADIRDAYHLTPPGEARGRRPAGGRSPRDGCLPAGHRDPWRAWFSARR